jgi:hypothetical protein
MKQRRFRARVLILAIGAALFPAVQAVAQPLGANDAGQHDHKKHHHSPVNVGEVNKGAQYDQTLIKAVPSQKHIFT